MIIQDTDRWGQLTDCYSVNDWGWLSELDWYRFDYYQQPLPSGCSIKEAEILLQDKMNVSGCKSALLQFDIQHRSGGWMRQVISLGFDSRFPPRLVRWSLVDCYIRRPLLLVRVWWRNLTFSPNP